MQTLIEALDPILSDPAVTEILVDGYNHVYVEKQGQLVDLDSPFENDAALITQLQEFASTFGRRLDDSNPIVDLRFADGSRMHIVIPPISLKGASFVIRKFPARQITWEDLLSFGSIDEALLEFIRACVLARLNIAISGGTGSGKTTILNNFVNLIPEDERLIVVQENTQLGIRMQRVVTLETRPANLEGKGEVTARDLMQSAMKMRPDRIILAEAHGAEVLELITAMNNGHDGSMTSLHAISPRDALARLELMANMGDPTIPLLRIREMLASALHILFHQERLSDGSRRIVRIAEVIGLQGDTIGTQDLFEFRQTGLKDGRIQGYFTPTGHIPRFLNRFREAGVEMDVQQMFSPR